MKFIFKMIPVNPNYSPLLTNYGEQRFFRDSIDFSSWNKAADLRWVVDACVCNIAERGYNERRNKDSNNNGSNGNKVEGGEFDPPLKPDVTSEGGRREIIKSLCVAHGPSGDTAVSDIASEVTSVLSEVSEGDRFACDNERVIVACGIIAACYLERFDRGGNGKTEGGGKTQEGKDDVGKIRVRAFDVNSTLALIAYDTVAVLERRGYHGVAVRVLCCLCEGGGI